MTFRVRENQSGIRTRLYDLEAEIMDVVWSHHLVRFSVNDVVTLLEKTRGLAYTTVMTTLARLAEKEILDRDRDGKRFLYSARFTREEFLQGIARDLLNGIDDRGGNQSLALLVEKVSEADAQTLDELESLIRRRRRELGE